MKTTIITNPAGYSPGTYGYEIEHNGSIWADGGFVSRKLAAKAAHECRASKPSPELLKALEALLAASAANHLPGIPELDDAQADAFAAIAKAKGEA